MSRQSGSATTLLEVARQAGVSMATASRAINGSTRVVREDLRLKVLEAAAALNYTANGPAQAVAKGRSNLVGLVVQDIADPYFSSIASGVMAAADQHGLIVTIGSTQRSAKRELDFVSALRGQRAAAVIIVGSRMDDPKSLRRLADELADFEDAGGRAAVVSQNRLGVDAVVVDNRTGAKHLSEALISLGYRRFAVLAGPCGLFTGRERLAGFTRGLQQAGLPLPSEAVVHGEFTRDGGYNAMQELLGRHPDIDCVFAVNDVMALGAMAAVRDAGVVPARDISIAGFDDIEIVRDVTPALTSVRIPLVDVGALALELVLQPRSEKNRIRRVGTTVVLRDSTPAVAAAALS